MLWCCIDVWMDSDQLINLSLLYMYSQKCVHVSCSTILEPTVSLSQNQVTSQPISDTCMNLVDYLLREKLNDNLHATYAWEGCLSCCDRDRAVIKIPYQLTAETIRIHTYIFLQYLFFGGKYEKNWLDSWLTGCWLVTWGWLGLPVGSCNPTSRSVLGGIFEKVNFCNFKRPQPY